MRTLAAIFLSLSAALLWTGCASYKMGDTRELPFASVYVAPVENHSLAPQAQAAVSAQLRTALLGGGLALEPRGTANAILQVSLTHYERYASLTSTTDTIVADAYDVTLHAKATLTSADGKTVYFKDLDVSATVQTHGTDSFGQAEYQAMPLLARELGRKIADKVTTLW